MKALPNNLYEEIVFVREAKIIIPFTISTTYYQDSKKPKITLEESCQR